MATNGFATLKSLLSTVPQSYERKSATNKTPSIPQKSLNQKEKKKAAFENWHKRKLDELQQKSFNGCQSELPVKSTEAKRTRTLSDSCSVSSTTCESPIPLSALSSLTQQLATTTDNSKSFPNPINVSRNASSSSNSNKDLTSPKLSRHNDAAFYPNIQCILCKEWVCSRNRYMHIESHLQYRPYKCSVCNYDNRKKIFIELHINKIHKGSSTVVYQPDPELEKRAWIMAEQCLQHTREVLLTADTSRNSDKQAPAKLSLVSTNVEQNVNSTFDKTLLAPYEDVYRPKIFNSQRNEKSLLIEESRQLGLIPDFSEVANREECCHLCKSYILRNPSLLEEHVRSHMSQPTYSCTFDDCDIRHCSRNFIFRHMKEVHKTRKNVRDLMESLPNLMDEFILLCRFCFPSFFNDLNANSDSNFAHKKKASDSSQNKNQLNRNNSVIAIDDDDSFCIGCQVGLTLNSDRSSCAECTRLKANPKGRLFCRFCSKFVHGDFILMQLHALEHCTQSPFSCTLCDYTACSGQSIRKHFSSVHSDQNNSELKNFVIFSWDKFDWRSLWMEMCSVCFSKKTENELINPKNEQINERSCCLCFADVVGGYDMLLDHTLKHLSCSKFACSYCEFDDDKESQIESHIRKVHEGMCVAVRMDITKESMDERGRLMGLCFPDVTTVPWASSSPPVNGKASTSSSILCKLCHDTLPVDDEHECLRHVERHISDSIFQCHFCHYKDVDVNRMKMHAQRLHHSPLYSKLTLDNELAAKFSQLMNFCFA